jgi:DNA-binding LacI/PurR family transcriptional regulator
LHYRPSRFGRGLVKADHRMLGLVLDDLTNPFYPQLAAAVTGAAARAGWNVVLTDTKHAADPRTLLGELSRQVDAVIGYLRLEPAVQRSLFEGLPVVEIDPARRQPVNGSVGLDLRPAIGDLVDHLVSAGVRRPLMLDQSRSGRRSARAKLFLAELTRRGLDAGYASVATGSTDTDLAAIVDVLDGHADPDALLAYNDLLAIGAMSVLRQRGRRVPQDVRVIGIDGLSIGDLVAPRLSTLAIDMAEVGRLATELALGMCSGELPLSGAAVRRSVRHRLLLRDSG